MPMPMKLGYIRSLFDECCGVDTSVKYQGGPVYNPLNKQGNTYQEISGNVMSTRPGFIRNLSDQQRGVNNAVKYQGDLIYNSLNKHGNTFQVFPANINKEFVEARNISKNNNFSIDFADYFLQDYFLFRNRNEIETKIESSNNEDNKDSLTFKDNKIYYKISFLYKFIFRSPLLLHEY
ncbi:MAG: hypothetical protein ACSLEN_02500 [Candidatus Malihini olakiniferum]